MFTCALAILLLFLSLIVTAIFFTAEITRWNIHTRTIITINDKTFSVATLCKQTGNRTHHRGVMSAIAFLKEDPHRIIIICFGCYVVETPPVSLRIMLPSFTMYELSTQQRIETIWFNHLTYCSISRTAGIDEALYWIVFPWQPPLNNTSVSGQCCCVLYTQRFRCHILERLNRMLFI